MVLLGNIRLDLRRAFFSFGFLLAIIGMTASLLSGVSTEEYLIKSGTGTDVLYLYRVAHLQGFSMLSVIFSTLPFATSFCTDWNNQFIRPTVIRSNIKSYGISKILTCALSGGSAVALGEVLFILLLHLYFPLVNRENPLFMNAASDPIYGGLLSSGNFILYFIFHILISFFASAFFAVLALWISTYLTNVFVTFASPIICFYLLKNLIEPIGLPPYLDLFSNLSGMVYQGQPVLSMINSILYFSFLCSLIAFPFIRQVKRRLEHG